MSRSSTFRMGILALLWGSSFVWIKIALQGVSPMQMVLLRLFLGAAVLLVLVRSRGLALPRDRLVWGRLFLAAAFANVLPFALFAIGERTVDSAVAGVLNGTTPLFAVVVALAVRAEPRLSPRRMACLAAAACYGVSFVYMGMKLANQGIPPLALSASQLLAATALAAVLVPFVGLQPVHLRPDVVGSIAILGIFGTGLAYVLNYRLITDEGAAATSTVAYLLPVVSVLLGAAILGDPITL